MGLLDDVMKALDRWSEWGPIRAAPAKVEALEKRVAELEQKLDGKCPPDFCKFCGERAARLSFSTITPQGLQQEEWECSLCQKTDVRATKPK